MNQIIEASAFDEEHIRKIWHKGEWYFSIVDIIASASERDQAAATEYWRKLRNRLRNEGNETVTKLDALKLPARDGKMRKTEIINLEQSFRVLQEIPGARTDRVKNWLAKVGAERLQEEEDSELTLLVRLGSTADRYKSEGRSNSWIVARITGIVTRKQFIDALKDAVLNVEPTMYAQATDRLYKGLWDRTTAQLRGELNITPKQNLRDHFGKYGLIYTRLAEEISGDKLNQTETVLLYQAMEIVWEVAKLISQQARATSELLGMDLVTEKPLLRGSMG